MADPLAWVRSASAHDHAIRARTLDELARQQREHAIMLRRGIAGRTPPSVQPREAQMGRSG
eukprot:7259676-Heterocapsa_arctica.AAC.1